MNRVSDAVGQGIENFFSALGVRLESHRESMATVDHLLSTRFNVFELFRPAEPMLSAILADLLDPNGTHGQGPVFLQSFVARLELDELADQVPRAVQCERRTNLIDWDGRRIDIVADFVRFGLGIENKPWAREQRDQIVDYQLELSRRYSGRYCLVYLTSDGRMPETWSAEERDRLKTMSYRDDLVGWLNDCIRSCASEKYRWFLRDFVEFVENRFPDTAEGGDS